MIEQNIMNNFGYTKRCLCVKQSYLLAFTNDLLTWSTKQQEDLPVASYSKGSCPQSSRYVSGVNASDEHAQLLNLTYYYR